MVPGTVVLLCEPRTLGDAADELRAGGWDVLVPDVAETAPARFVARAALLVGAANPVEPLVLVGFGGAGPLLPALASAQRAAHRAVAGYVFVDARLPSPEGPHAPALPGDWPDAPCGYLLTRSAQGPGTEIARQCRLRGWVVRERDAGAALATALRGLIEEL
ncbi:hypothetical protein [Actinomadura atramentaria]|uniref:hypothetical protein n=1 Tax=Actinomadura atramentaria TaxID=1990 RepID=UPI0003750AEB|nr:hypothetical protein [Actinomadura atramentaria]